MNYILGLGVATVSIMAALMKLHQGPERYWDFVAFAMVLGGTLAVSVIILPWSYWGPMTVYFRKLLIHWGSNKKKFIQQCLNALETHKRGEPLSLESSPHFHDKTLKEGMELVSLGLETKKIESILRERLYQHTQMGSEISGALRSLGKYPPAFGLTGTVFGLVELMRGVTEGLPAQQTGYKMAIALVATLYGLLVANLLVNPAGEFIRKLNHEEKELAEMAVQAVLLAAERVNLLEAQEVLNSFVPEKDRVDVLSMPTPHKGVA